MLTDAQKAAKKRYRENNPEAYKASCKRQSLKRGPDYWRKVRYGISQEDYDRMVSDQEGKCAICCEEAKLHVDHDHATKKVRGLLCVKCNTAIGKLDGHLEAAIKYLSACN